MSIRMHAALAAAALAIGCQSPDTHEPGAEPALELLSEDEAGAEEASRRVGSEWRRYVASADPMLRAAATEVIPADPGDDGSAVLEHLATADPRVRVRERAVVAYGSVRGRDAIPFLREVALSQDDNDVTAAAFAELGRVRAEAAEPPRGSLNVELPKSFSVGEDFDLVITLGSTEDVTEARLGVRLPRSLVVVSGHAPEWRGPVSANHPETLVIRLRSVGPIDRAGLRASLHLDYPEALDAEDLRRSYRVWTDGDDGHFAEAETITQRLEMTLAEPGR